ncbi:hypothetical protein ACRAWC_22170 [Leifsonia sp. L25]|uniref:hypothetical protein n=1 Tax=Leifsonia sp. L25 TaxID=3423957 RepID=UPI003D68247F
MHVLIDVKGLGVSGYQVADWLRAEHRIDVGLNDHRTHRGHAVDGRRRRRRPGACSTRCANSRMPRRVGRASGGLASDRARTPARHRPVAPRRVLRPGGDGAGRRGGGEVAAEQVTPTSGIPALMPGEVINRAIVDHLRTGLAAGMVIPDAADASLETFRVTRSLPPGA